MVKNITKKNITTLLLLTTDTISIYLAFFTAYYLRNFNFFKKSLDSIQSLSIYLQALPFAVLIFIVIFYWFGLYQLKQRLTRLGEAKLIFQATSVCILLIMAGSYLVKYDYSRFIIINLWLFTLIFIILDRYFFNIIQKKFNLQNIGLINVLIIGCGKPAKNIAHQLKYYQNLGFKLAGHISATSNQNNDLQVLGNLDNLFSCIEKYNIDKVFIAEPSLSYEKTLNLIHDCPNKNIEFSIASNIFSLISEFNNLTSLEDLPIIDLKKSQPNIFYLISKRILDIALSLIALIITMPLWLIISWLIKKDSIGPALFTQNRVGKDGKIFKIYKFRTMSSPKITNEQAPTTADDPRITKIGKKLRRWSVDELPQLINIIKGEMSIVGPRPEMPFIVETYSPWQRKRLAVKPGLTGLWQILGRKDLPLHENLEYDFYYINNQSFFLDLMIILKTIPMLIGGQGAY